MPFSRADQQMIMSSFSQLNSAMEKWKRDKMYNELLNELDPPRAGTADGSVRGEHPHRGGMAEYEMLTAREDRELKRAMMEANIAKSLREPKKGVDYVDTEYGQMTPFQAAQIAGKKKGAPLYDTPYGPMSPSQAADYDLRRRELDRKAAAESQTDFGDPALESIDREIAKARGEIAKGNVRPGPDWLHAGRAYAETLSELGERKAKLTQSQPTEPNPRPYATQARPSMLKPSGDSSVAVRVSTPEERDALPPGTKYIAPDGTVRIKR